MPSPTTRPCFNEAAAHGRGKRQAPEVRPRDVARFNEAAAHGRGKRKMPGDYLKPKRASMRPRRMAAENSADMRSGHGWRRASMRPRRMAAENRRLDFFGGGVSALQ